MAPLTGLRRLSDQEARRRQLRILDTVAEHCRRNGITFFLCAGTLLGAVRHEGYIPWDDDIDIMLPRADFERLCATFPATGATNHLTLRSRSTVPDYQLPFAKVCDDDTLLDVESDIIRDIGVYIDVFPLDGWYPSGPRRTIQRLGLKALNLLIRTKHLSRGRSRGLGKNLLLAMGKGMLSPVPARLLSAGLTWVATRAGYERSTDVGVIVWGYRESIPRRCYAPASIVAFEGREMPAPADATAVLERIYGDYRALPPVERRVTHHRFVAYARSC